MFAFRSRRELSRDVLFSSYFHQSQNTVPFTLSDLAQHCSTANLSRIIITSHCLQPLINTAASKRVAPGPLVRMNLEAGTAAARASSRLRFLDVGLLRRQESARHGFRLGVSYLSWPMIHFAPEIVLLPTRIFSSVKYGDFSSFQGNRGATMTLAALMSRVPDLKCHLIMDAVGSRLTVGAVS
jgi:hypothetical protein